MSSNCDVLEESAEGPLGELGSHVNAGALGLRFTFTVRAVGKREGLDIAKPFALTAGRSVVGGNFATDKLYFCAAFPAYPPAVCILISPEKVLDGRIQLGRAKSAFWSFHNNQSFLAAERLMFH